MKTAVQEVTKLREQLRAKGVPVARLAYAAGVYPNDMYRILAGSSVGPTRRARITEAARTLGLTDEDA